MNPYAAPSVSQENDGGAESEFQFIAPRSTRGEILLTVAITVICVMIFRQTSLLKKYHLEWAGLFSPIISTSLLNLVSGRFFLSRLRRDVARYPVVHSGEALLAGLAHKNGWSLTGGYLFLTRQELVYFSRNGAWDDGRGLRIPLSEITSVIRGRRFGLARDAILIHMESGKVQRFATFDAATWIREIYEAWKKVSA